jgi:DNA repair protein RadA/Sms
MALMSSYRNRAVDSASLVFGEVGLTGEIRAVSQAELRVMEAVKMGYQKCIMPKSNAEKLPKGIGMKIFGVSNIKEISNYSS